MQVNCSSRREWIQQGLVTIGLAPVLLPELLQASTLVSDSSVRNFCQFSGLLTGFDLSAKDLHELGRAYYTVLQKKYPKSLVEKSTKPLAKNGDFKKLVTGLADTKPGTSLLQDIAVLWYNGSSPGVVIDNPSIAASSYLQGLVWKTLEIPAPGTPQGPAWKMLSEAPNYAPVKSESLKKDKI